MKKFFFFLALALAGCRTKPSPPDAGLPRTDDAGHVWVDPSTIKPFVRGPHPRVSASSSSGASCDAGKPRTYGQVVPGCAPTPMTADKPGCTIGQNFFSADSGAGKVLTGDIHFYVNWYGTGSSNWPNTGLQLWRAYLNGLSSTPLWSALQQYPNGGNNAFRSARIVQECFDPGNEGNFSPTCPTNTITANLTPSGCAFPYDENGIYITIPSSVAAYVQILGGTAEGCHTDVSFGTQQFLTTAIAIWAPNSSTSTINAWPEPNLASQGDGFDGLISAITHEIVEGLTDPGPSAGWMCPPPSSLEEVMDWCQGGPGDGLVFVGDAGQAANITITVPNWPSDGGAPMIDSGTGVLQFAVQNMWQGGVWDAGTALGGAPNVCANQLVSKGLASRTCCTASDCALSSLSRYVIPCVNGKCVIPTCTDGIQDGDEPDVDCSAGCAVDSYGSGRCGVSQKCFTTWDCHTIAVDAGISAYAYCDAGRCQ